MLVYIFPYIYSIANSSKLYWFQSLYLNELLKTCYTLVRVYFLTKGLEI